MPSCPWLCPHNSARELTAHEAEHSYYVALCRKTCEALDESANSRLSRKGPQHWGWPPQMGSPDSLINVSFLYEKSWKEWETPGISHLHNRTPKEGCADSTAAVMVKAKGPGPTPLFSPGTRAAWRNDCSRAGAGSAREALEPARKQGRARRKPTMSQLCRRGDRRRLKDDP